MKPYYRKNGFFDLSERLSDWIDFYCKMVKSKIRYYGLMYYIPGFNRLSIISAYITDYEETIKDCESFIKELKAEYNREKYFWMAKK